MKSHSRKVTMNHCYISSINITQNRNRDYKYDYKYRINLIYKNQIVPINNYNKIRFEAIYARTIHRSCDTDLYVQCYLFVAITASNRCYIESLRREIGHSYN